MRTCPSQTHSFGIQLEEEERHDYFAALGGPGKALKARIANRTDLNVVLQTNCDAVQLAEQVRRSAFKTKFSGQAQAADSLPV